MKNYINKILKCLIDNNYRFSVLSSLGVFNGMNDKKYIEKKFKNQMGYSLDLENPITYNEKIQWLKLYDRNSKYIYMADKYEAKKIVSNILGDEYVVPTIGIYDDFDKINFEELPNQFVMKCTHDSGGVIVCKEKKYFNYKEARKKINKNLKKNYFFYGREWPYKNINPRIIIEKYLEDSYQKEIIDYKFFCFNGKVEYLYISEGSHTLNQKIQFFDKNYLPIDCSRSDYNKFERIPKKPKNFDKMIEFAELLSKNIEHIRIDFYEINGQLYFSEFTFYTGSGYVPFNEKHWDFKFGSLINLDHIKKH